MQRSQWASKVDWDEYIEDGRLTELHLIVSGLRNRDLEKYIRAHPEELERTDYMGFSPLRYAGINGELADFDMLLKYGATINEKNFHLSTILSIAGSKAFDVMEKHLSSAALRSIIREGYARSWFVDSHSGYLDCDETLAVDKLCLQHGLDVNDEDYQEGTTLLMEMLRRSYPILPLRVKQLLDHGADLELTDIYGNTTLHHLIETYWNYDITPKTLTMLLEKGARLDYRTRDGTTMLHALVFNVAHLEPIEIISHSDISGLLLDAKDRDGYTAFDLLILRARLLRQDPGDCPVSPEVWQDDIYEVFNTVIILEKLMNRAIEPDMERKVLTAFEALLHKVQELQGIPPEEQYPSVESVLDKEDKDAEASRLEGLPGSWPE